MSHAVESMFYVGEMPWHKLGYRFESAPETVSEAIQAAGLDWTVRKVQASVKVNGSYMDIPDTFAMVRDRGASEKAYRIGDASFTESEWNDLHASAREAFESTGKLEVGESGGAKHDVLGTVGRVYQPLQNSDAFATFEPFLQQGLKFETAGSLFGGKRVWILAKAGDDLIVNPAVEGDAISRYVLLSHSHDGSTAINFGLTPVRVVCANTEALAISDKRSKLIKVRHTQSASDALDAASRSLSIANQQFEMTVEQYRALAKASIGGGARKKMERYIKLVFSDKKNNLAETPEKDLSAQFRNLLSRLLEIFETAPGQQRSTWWDAYNTISYYYSHLAARNAENRYASLWFGLNAAKNSRALAIAMKQAGLTGK